VRMLYYIAGSHGQEEQAVSTIQLVTHQNVNLYLD
jgi:hypothetical protein